MWSRICTTWPEKPHCGNCGVPFMNSTTSFAFTSLSMNCSMLILASFCRRMPPAAWPSRTGPADVIRYWPICNPKPLFVQSKMAGSWHAGQACRDGVHSLTTLISWPPEAFFPKRKPYLGRTVVKEPVCQSNVLSPTGDTCDEISIRRGRPFRLAVTVLRFRDVRPESRGRLSGRAGRDRAPRRALEPRGSADPVHAGREPGAMAPRPHHLVLRAIFAR